MKINIIVPVYNEENLVANTLSTIMDQVRSDYHVIVVDDGSVDRTGVIVDQFVRNYPEKVVVLRQPHEGFSAAVRKGLACVPSGDVFVTVMGDCCDEVCLIDEMYRLISREAVDVVCASRYIRGGGRVGGLWVKAFGSWLVNRCFAILLRGACHDSTNAFKMFRKNILESIVIESKGFDIFLELTIKSCEKNLCIVEIPTIWRERTKGRSKFGIFQECYKYWKWMLYSRRLKTLGTIGS